MNNIFASLKEANEDGFYSISQIAKMYGTTRQNVHQWLRSSDKNGFPVSGRVYKRNSLQTAPVIELAAVGKWLSRTRKLLRHRSIAR